MSQSIRPLLLNNKPLWKWANATVHHEHWALFAAMVKAHLLNSCALNSENQKGINMVFEAMLDLTDTEPTPKPEIESGLHHNLDVPERSVTTQTKAK